MTTRDTMTVGSTRDRDYDDPVALGDRIRWGPIIAGLFVSLSTLIVLGVLGAAIGLSTFERGEDTARGFSIGAGIWGIISMILAFLVGGWVASKWAPVTTTRAALWHGLLVWAVAIPLSLFVLGSMGTILGGAAATNADERASIDFRDSARTAGATIGERTADEPDEDPAQRRAAGAAWTTLVSLILGLAAAATGGYLGAAGRRDDTYYRGTTTTTTTGTGV